ncbi:hypothetical protein CYMTET_41095 [Cymbomonas tetramitiformis]|uniref:Uncharacterized protein n=1 Tax=Cymbomonas tetramitiformis TaxID=36881 RepID=A0AAE0F3Z9_9CHLO|nr:hypothetical protein CYMTET_41095 [Cymbomonas tetramitiformis]
MSAFKRVKGNLTLRKWSRKRFVRVLFEKSLRISASTPIASPCALPNTRDCRFRGGKVQSQSRTSGATQNFNPRVSRLSIEAYDGTPSQ